MLLFASPSPNSHTSLEMGPGAAKRSQEESRSQDEPGGQEEPEGVGSSQEQPSSHGEPRGRYPMWARRGQPSRIAMREPPEGSGGKRSQQERWARRSQRKPGRVKKGVPRA